MNSAYRQYTGYRAYPLGLPAYRLAVTATAGEPVLPSGTYKNRSLCAQPLSRAEFLFVLLEIRVVKMSIDAQYRCDAESAGGSNRLLARCS